MNLRVFRGNEVGARKESVVRGIRQIEVDFTRNTYTVRYAAANGSQVVENGELSELSQDGVLPDFLFYQGENNMSDEGKVNMESAVGHLVDPTTTPTHGAPGNKDSKVSTGDPSDSGSTGKQDGADSTKGTPAAISVPKSEVKHQTDARVDKGSTDKPMTPSPEKVEADKAKLESDKAKTPDFSKFKK